MSCRNLFVIHLRTGNIDLALTKIKFFLESINRGFALKPKNYLDELISKIDDCNYYFAITDNVDEIECEEIFDLEKSFFKSLLYPKIIQSKKEQEFLQEQFSFIDDVVAMIFSTVNVDSIELFISDQVSNYLEDFYEVELINKSLARAIANSYQPRRREKYIGLKTTKFVIKCK